MIDIKQFLTDLWTPLNDYAEPSQLLLKDQQIPTDQLKPSRIVYGFINFADTGARQSVIRTDDLIASEEEEWDYDIETGNINFPRGTVSFTCFGPEGKEDLGLIREWFNTVGIGDWWLRENEAVIRNITSVQDRTVYLETDYEERYGFDVELQFKDIVKNTFRTIEKVQITAFDEEYTIGE